MGNFIWPETITGFTDASCEANKKTKRSHTGYVVFMYNHLLYGIVNNSKQLSQVYLLFSLSTEILVLRPSQHWYSDVLCLVFK